MAVKARKSAKSTVSDALSIEDLVKRIKALSGSSLIEALQNQKILSPLVIVGDEEIRIRRLITWLRDRFTEFKPSPNIISMSGSQITSSTTVRTLLQAQNTLSLFSPINVVIMTEAHLIKSTVGKPLVDNLRIASPCSFTIVTGNVPNQKTVILNDMLAFGTSVNVDKLAGDALRKWISQEIIRLGHSGGITPEATELLARSYEECIDLLSQDLSRLSLILEANDSITADVIRRHFRIEQEHTSFELLNAVARGNVSAVSAITRKLISDGAHPLQLCSFLSRAVRILIAQHHPSSGKLPADISNPWMLRQMKVAQSSLREEDLKFILRELLILDEKLKSSGLPVEELFELMLLNLALKIEVDLSSHSWSLGVSASG